MAPRSLSPARRAACEALLKLDATSAHFDEVMRGEPTLAALDGRDAALAWELVAGVTRRRLTLDAVVASFSAHPLGRLDPRARAALRLGAYQLLYLDRVPPPAAVDESAQLVARLGRRTVGFVNAVLRRVAGGGAARLQELTAANDTACTALRYSCPEWLVALLMREWDDERAHALLAAADRAPHSCLRVNQLATTVEEARAALAEARIETALPEPRELWRRAAPDALLYSGGPLERSAAFRDGRVTPQSLAAQLVGVVAAGSTRGEAHVRTDIEGSCALHVADLCAAPGVKTGHLAALLPGCRILAVENEPARAADLEGTLVRLKTTGVDVLTAEATDLPAELDGGFDLVLLDAPCTGLGTLAERPDLRWHRRPEDVPRMAALQRALGERAARLLRPGGTLVYAVCTLTRDETIGVVQPLATAAGLAFDDLGASFPELRDPHFGPALLTLPDRDATSGFFIARLRRPEMQP